MDVELQMNVQVAAQDLAAHAAWRAAWAPHQRVLEVRISCYEAAAIRSPSGGIWWFSIGRAGCF